MLKISVSPAVLRRPADRGGNHWVSKVDGKSSLQNKITIKLKVKWKTENWRAGNLQPN